MRLFLGTMLGSAMFLGLCQASLADDFSNSGDFKPLFDKPLTSPSVFDKPSDLGADTSSKSTSNSGDASFTKATTAAAAAQLSQMAKMQDKMNTSFMDNNLRQQMNTVSTWLQEYGRFNQGRFPAVTQGSLDQQWAAQAQLTELVANNPYGSANYQAPESDFSGNGYLGESGSMPAYWNSDGTPKTGSPTQSDEWLAEVQAQQMGRVQLKYDPSLTPLAIDQWRTDPPYDWQGAPGTIGAIGNYQGLFCVWGIGKNGKPLKDLTGKNTFIVVGSNQLTQNDLAAPNEK